MKDFSVNTLNYLKSIESDASRYIDKVYGSIRSRINSWSKNENNNNVNKEESVDNYAMVFKPSPPGLNLTNDSGITSCKEDSPKLESKKLCSSSQNNAVLDIDPDANRGQFHSSTPTKRSEGLPNISKPQLIGTQSAEVITKEVIAAANLNRGVEEFTRPEDLFQCSILSNTTPVRAQSCKSVEEKFVVNLFESRPSKKWKKQNISVENPSQILIINESRPETKPEPVAETQNNCGNLDGDHEEFERLKRARNVECVKMTQASNILTAVKMKPSKEWKEELLAENILLEANENYKLLVNKIRALNYPEVKTQKSKHLGTVTLSNFQYELKPQETKKNNYSMFYILSLSYETDLLMSKVTTATNDRLIFEDKFTFKNVDPDFNIKAQVFSLKVRTSGRTSHNLLKKKNRCKWCPMSKIYYENVTTNELKESKVLKSSFVSQAETNIKREDAGQSSFLISPISECSQLKNTMTFSLILDDLEINANLSGFLTLGLPNKDGDVLYWDRKWCVLNGTQLSVFNYPSEEYLGKPMYTIDLRNCLVPFAIYQKSYLRKRNFLIKTGRLSFTNEIKGGNIERRERFAVNKYVFAADTNEEFSAWTGEIKAILDCLMNWGKLVYGENHC